MSLTLTWLGQAGYLVDIGGLRLAIDPYLSDSVERIAPSLKRSYPPPMAPDRLDADAILFTHDHLDHLDPDTLRAIPAPWPVTIGPRNVCRHLAALGQDSRRTLLVEAGQEVSFRGVGIRGTFAIPNGEDVADTVGFLLSVGGRTLLYHCGDTAYHPFLHYIAGYRPAVALLCINGKMGNMSADEAAELARALQPRVAIPNHYDLFAANSADPQAFVQALAGEPSIRTIILPRGERYDLAPHLWDETS